MPPKILCSKSKQKKLYPNRNLNLGLSMNYFMKIYASIALESLNILKRHTTDSVDFIEDYPSKKDKFIKAYKLLLNS